MADVKTIIAGASLPTRSVPLCLHGGLTAEHERLEQQLAEAQEAATDDRLVGKSQARQIAEQIQALRQEMLDSTVTFELRGLPRHRFRALVDAHPPRRDADGKVVDEDLPGVNAETFYEALIRASVVAPALDDEDWANLLGVHVEHEGPCRLDNPDVDNPNCPCREEVLTSRQFDQLSRVAWNLNRHEVSVPFSHAASRVLSTSDNG